jgi:hypothetical protein
MNVKDVIEKYGSYICEFVSHHKHTFVFEMEETGILVFADGIYRSQIPSQISVEDISEEFRIMVCRFPDGTYTTNRKSKN